MELIPKYQQGGNTYTVKKGDSPWKISHDNGISLDEFYRLNPFARKMIHPNQVVKLRETPKKKVTYIPRQSVELLKGVEVVASKKPKVTSKPQKQKPSNDSIRKQKIVVENTSSNKQIRM